MLYRELASLLQEISLASREQKALLAAGLLTHLEQEMLCPAIRLLLGELWPSWEIREMGMGPEAVMAALSEVSKEDVRLLQKERGEMGAVAEVALQRKSQLPLSDESLDALAVYERLRHVSRIDGPDSERRKQAVLRGLFLEASPREGRYIARTALRNMLTGLGPQTMISAISQAFGYDYQEIQRAYNLLPELGQVACASRKRELEKIKIQPGRPVKPMIIPPGEAEIPGTFLPLFPGLMVQVHRADRETSIFTSRQKNITLALDGLCQELGSLEEEMIVQAALIGFQEGRMLGWEEMVRYINRRHLSRKSSIVPALMAYDLIYLQGEDLTELAYEERRRRLLKVLGEPREAPFRGISPAEEKLLVDLDAVEEYCLKAKREGCKGLIERDPNAAYYPGSRSSRDFIIGEEETVAAAIVRAEYGRGKAEKMLIRYRVALRNGDDLVPVAWVSAGRSSDTIRTLSDRLQSLVWEQSPEGVNVRPKVVLLLKVRGARCSGEARLVQPKIKGISFDAAPEEVDDLESLEKICKR